MATASVASDWLLALDPVTFARATGFNPEPWQEKVLRSNARRILLNCSRQSGKSSTVAALACHTALYVPNSTTLIVSYAMRHSVELFRKVISSGSAVKFMPTVVVGATQTSFEFANGSRVVALPGSEASIRSFSNVHTLLFDEASHVPTETYEAARPVVAATGGGRIIALSTPFGTRGWWYEAWRDDGPDAEPWERYMVTAAKCPHIRSDFLAQEKRRMGSWWFDQEYRCVFTDAQDAVFRQEDIDRMFAEDYETWDLSGEGDRSGGLEAATDTWTTMSPPSAAAVAAASDDPDDDMSDDPNGLDYAAFVRRHEEGEEQ